MWPFQTKQLLAYLGEHQCLAVQTQGNNSLNKHQATLRIAPCFSRCIALPASSVRLDKNELRVLAQHWGKKLMGQHWSAWQWQAFQVQLNQAILLCACKVEPHYLSAFQKVVPEIIYQIEHLDANESAWLVCRDEVLVQSALLVENQILSIRTWPAMYSTTAQEVVETHRLLATDLNLPVVHRIVESRCGELSHHALV